MALSLLLITASSKAQIPVASPSPDLPDLATEIAATGNLELASQLFARAVQVAETIEDKATKINALSAIAIKLGEVGQTQKANLIFDRAIQVSKQTDDNFTLYYQEPARRDIAIAMAKAGIIQRALQFIETINSDFRQAEALNAIAPILAENGETEQARQILLKALSKARGITGDYAYEANGSCGNDKFEVLSKIAANLSLLNQFDTALEVAKSVTGCSSANGDSSEDYQAWAYLGILANMANAEQVKPTWIGSQTMQNGSEKMPVWSQIGQKLAAMGEVDLALTVAEKISQEFQTVTAINSGLDLREFGEKERSLSRIAIELAKKQQFETALKIAQTIQELTPEQEAAVKQFNLQTQPSIKALTLGEIAREYAKIGKIEPALQLVNSIGNQEGKALGIIAIAQGLQTTGQAAQADKLLSQNLQPPAIPPTDNFEANQSISRIAVALVTVGKVDQALQIAQSIKNDTTKEQAIANIASQLSEMGQMERAFQIANAVNSVGFKQEALNKIAAKYLELGQLEQASQVTKLIPADSNIDILANLADGFAKAGKTEQALQVAQTIANDSVKAIAIANVAAMLVPKNN
ncbi:MAG TPA: hypothetical protein DCY88_29710 [Cyanobacteria bacterium UBA11372]|nr:hypothetical protein [Cyanobacteria bacterium UBA11372]